MNEKRLGPYKLVYYTLRGRDVVTTDLETWARGIEDAEARRVGYDEVDGAQVSTVFIGIDHGFGMFGGRPLVFETMVFGGPLDDACERYSTYDEAEAGHADMLRRVTEAARGGES